MAHTGFKIWHIISIHGVLFYKLLKLGELEGETVEVLLLISQAVW